ncbi:hypothetical protein ACN9MB_05235 [Dyella kyungheensis]|uniref:hypothetical protein n=1 Tax=Dyella kyungheensis TaxID=1242174 RepID=UPI003CF9694C
MRENGHRVAGKGHRVFCPKCKGIYPITGGIDLPFGYAPGGGWHGYRLRRAADRRRRCSLAAHTR